MRTTYIDNSGLERFEDNCKIVPNMANREILNAMDKFFNQNNQIYYNLGDLAELQKKGAKI